MSKITITISGDSGTGKTLIGNDLKKFLQREGYNLDGVDDVVEFLKEGQKTDTERETEQHALEGVKQHAEIEMHEAHEGDKAGQILENIRARKKAAPPEASAEELLEKLRASGP